VSVSAFGARDEGVSISSDVTRRARVNEEFFTTEADGLASLCHQMAERFARGGRLLAIGATAVDESDARHVAVEFVHPVIVGKRALSALALPPAHVALVARSDDILIAFGAGPVIAGAVREARDRGCLTLAFARVGANCELVAPTDDPFIAQELAETAYHVLWELVHVFFEHRGLLEGRDAAPVHDTGASSFLYPFLGEQETDLAGVLHDVRSSILMKAQEVTDLRIRTLAEAHDELRAAAAALRLCLDGGGTILAAGNGGSATDAMDAVADLRDPPQMAGRPHRPRRRALDLTADAPILTAIANDIGPDELFVRQVIAYGMPGDALLTFSTSGSSRNIIAALAEARRRGVVTIALVGYDGGRIAAEGLADHIIVTRSEHIPRIQEAQATAWHVLRDLIEAPG
jgi:D-sedoheptulose 7-phosphate isomerase